MTAPLLNQAPAAAAGVQPPLLEVNNLVKFFPIRGGLLSQVVANVKAVNNVSFSVAKGEVLGLVGESGSGKTTAGRAILRLIEPTSGEVKFEGVDVVKLSKGQMREYRRKMQIIFQDPFASLNPRMTVADIIGEALQIHNIGTKGERIDRIADLLRRVGLIPDHMRRYPHEFSGGAGFGARCVDSGPGCQFARRLAG
jgi:peptide/nickel transport system ATP-binding protein